MTQEKEIFDTITKIIDDYMPDVIKGKITMDTPINNELGVDSLGFVLIVSKLEAKYHLKIKDRQFAKFVTVGDVVRYLDKRLSSSKE